MIPGVSGAIAGEKKKMLSKVANALPTVDDGEPVVTTLPDEGLASSVILKRFEKLTQRESKKVHDQRLSGTVYISSEEHEQLLTRTMSMFLHVNTLHSDVFPSARKFESEIVRMTSELMRGGRNTCGVVTSGGTESILMAVKTYRDRARVERGITEGWEVIASTTVHAAFDKACHYFGCKLIHVQADPTRNYTISAKAVREKLSSRTILIVASAPNFPQGTIDPVEELAQVARSRPGIGLHVDCCLGGFILPFARQIPEFAAQIPPFDFSVQGVTSISADTHKYGLACKGSSVLLFASRALRHHMYFVAPSWTGGIYGSPTMPGSRSGVPLAATWASMMHMGRNGYMKQATDILSTARELKQGIAEIKELKLQGDAPAMVVAFESRDDQVCDIFVVADAMSERGGWALNTLQYPKGVHFAVTLNTVGKVGAFLNDLRACVRDVCEHPERFKKGLAPVYGAAISLPDKQLVVDIVSGFIDATIDGPFYAPEDE